MSMEANLTDSRLSQLKEMPRRTALYLKISLAAGLLAVTMPLGAETNPTNQKALKQRTTAEENIKEKKTTIFKPSELRKMVLKDDHERAFIALKESPDEYIEIGLSDKAFGITMATPELEKLAENSKGVTLIHTHPLGIYNVAGYTSDQISAAREGLMPIPLSLPPSILDLLESKRFADMQTNTIKQKIYGTDGVWSFEGGNSTLFAEIGQINSELAEIFLSFRASLPKNLQEHYNKILSFAENEGDAQQGIICRDINELAKDPELRGRLGPLEEKLAKLTVEYDQAFASMEEMIKLNIDMTHPEKRDAAMKRYLEVVEQEGFKVKFEPYKAMK